MNPTHLVSVAALVTNEKGEVLLVKSPWRGWEYPGGLIEPGETFQEALHREVREEAGVEIEITGFVGICKNVEKDIVNIDFTARYLSGELTTSEESTEVVWASPEQAMEMITFPLTKKRLANMLSGRKEAALFCFQRDPFTVVEDTAFPLRRRVGHNVPVRIIPYEERYRDDMIFMVLEAKNALGRVPGLNEDLLDICGNYFDKGDMFWLAIDEKDRVIGCVGYNSIEESTEATLHRLYVKFDLKRQGIGSALLHTAEAHMRDVGKTAVYVHLGGKEYFESHSFYPKHGYTEYGPSHMKKLL